MSDHCMWRTVIMSTSKIRLSQAWPKACACLAADGSSTKPGLLAVSLKSRSALSSRPCINATFERLGLRSMPELACTSAGRLSLCQAATFALQLSQPDAVDIQPTASSCTCQSYSAAWMQADAATWLESCCSKQVTARHVLSSSYITTAEKQPATCLPGNQSSLKQSATMRDQPGKGVLTLSARRRCDVIVSESACCCPSTPSSTPAAAFMR